MECGEPTKWIELPLEGRIHTWTTCHFGGEAFLKETPFNLILVEFDGVTPINSPTRPSLIPFIVPSEIWIRISGRQCAYDPPLSRWSDE